MDALLRQAITGEGRTEIALLFKPAVATRGGRPELGSEPMYIRPRTLAKHLNNALAKCKLPRITWYQATRHTFASQFVPGGGGIELLSKIMGHASIPRPRFIAICAMTYSLKRRSMRLVWTFPNRRAMWYPSRVLPYRWADFGHTRCAKRRTKPA